MSQLSTKQSTALAIMEDFAVIDGEGYVSQRKLAELCGVKQPAISKWISRQIQSGIALNINANKQLDAKSAFQSILYFATKGKRKTAANVLNYLNKTGSTDLSTIPEEVLEPKVIKNLAGYVYLVECQGYLKIGYAKNNVKLRVSTLQIGNPFPINLIYAKEFKDGYCMESYLHKYFKGYLHRGEWFTGVTPTEIINVMNNSQLKTLADNVSIIQSKLASPSKEVLPAYGYASIKDLEIQVASEFPKTLLRALIAEHNEVRSMSCTKWIEGANTYVDYTAYCVMDVLHLVKNVIDSGQRVLKADGTPSTKLESPLFTQPFKHPMR